MILSLTDPSQGRLDFVLTVVKLMFLNLYFLLVGLNDVEVSACDISGAYLNAPVGEKVWFVAGAACGSMQGTTMIITRTLYGLKTNTKAWSEFFAGSLKEMGYLSCRAGPDIG